MYAMVSRPGPVEIEVLEELSPSVSVRRRVGSKVTLRTLEGGPEKSGEPPIVLLHGRGHAASMWLPLLPALARERRVIAIDLPGFGHSSAEPFGRGSTDEAVRFFTDPMELMLMGLGIQEPILIGHSLGGLVSVEIALRGSLRPRGLGLIGSMALGPAMSYPSRAFFRAGPERVARVMGPAITRRISNFPDTPQGRKLSALEYELYSVRGGRPDAAAAFNALFPAVGEAFNRLPHLPEITCPALLLWGGRDEVFPPSVAEGAARVMQKPELRIEKDLGHAPHIEAPDRIVPVILDFIARL
ncbi:MAG TPA: alpha/beta fold hydrolase [Polyangiaceae bacterium]|nr:alpha/beta fold hydrolase [Polyangiaceae bacterium]